MDKLKIPTVKKADEWLNDRALAISPEATGKKIAPVLANDQLADAAIADTIVTMVVKGEID